MRAQANKTTGLEESTTPGAGRDFYVVTGAFGYTGRYIARKLLRAGKRVRTLTAHAGRPHAFGNQVEVASFDFDDPDSLRQSLRGASTLFNTYWIRFAYGRSTFESAVENSKTLIQAAADAGVRRLVHLSITNPSLDSRLPYFLGKALVEEAIQESGLSHAILRPTVVFGPEDILINNIAWLLRRFPLFAIPGSGDYRLQPIFVEDLAEQAVAAAGLERNLIQDAVGPEVFTFSELVNLIADALRSRAKRICVKPEIALTLSRILGSFVRDVMLTRDEIDGLMSNLLVSSEPPVGRTKFTAWLKENAGHLGARYASELARHFRPSFGQGSLGTTPASAAESAHARESTS